MLLEKELISSTIEQKNCNPRNNICSVMFVVSTLKIRYAVIGHIEGKFPTHSSICLELSKLNVVLHHNRFQSAEADKRQ